MSSVYVLLSALNDSPSNFHNPVPVLPDAQTHQSQVVSIHSHYGFNHFVECLCLHHRVLILQSVMKYCLQSESPRTRNLLANSEFFQLSLLRHSYAAHWMFAMQILMTTLALRIHMQD